MTNHRDTNSQADALKDEGRRDFTRSLIAAGGSLLIAPLAGAAAARPRPRVTTCPVNNAYGDDPTPKSRRIYFFYLTNGPERTRAYFIELDKDISEDELKAQMEPITTKVRNGLTPIGKGFGAFEFVHKSYFVAVLDDDKEELVPKNAIKFANKSDGGNNSFKDGKDIQLFGGAVTGFYCFNHMKDRQTGMELGHKSENFSITANHRKRGSTSCRIARAHSDTGTNTGPPRV